MRLIDRDAVILLLAIIVFIGVGLCGTIVFFVVIASIWQQGGEFLPQPSGNILVTAEYLYANPPPLSQGVQSFYFDEHNNEACVTLSPSSQNFLMNRWFLNGERVPSNRYTVHMYGDGSYPHPNCVVLDGILTGIHLIEIEMNASPFYRIGAYQWAIKIEPSPTPSRTP